MSKLLSKQSVTIRDFIANCNNETVADIVTSDNLAEIGLSNVVSECDVEVTVSDSECKSLAFIAGYVGYKLVSNVTNCPFCISELVTEHLLEIDVGFEQYEYLHDLDRGGLKWPTDLLVEIIMQVFFIFNCLVSPKYQSVFLVLKIKSLL